MQDLRPLCVAAILTWIAGIVDAVGFISLGHIYTANMSGNSIAIGIEGARQHWAAFLARLWPVAMFFVGLLFCRLLIECGARMRMKSIASVTVGIEIALLLPVALSSGVPGHVSQAQQIAYVALLALAMGVQNAALTHFSRLTLHTGFVTGTLLKAAQQAAVYVTWLFDETRREGVWPAISESPRQEAFRQSATLVAIWAAYVAGAALGTLGLLAYRFRALFVSLAALLVVIGLDLKQPLAREEEQRQVAQNS